MLTKTLSEAKKKQRNILIKAMNNDIGSIDSAKDSWNPAQISERAKDISYIRSLVDTWNPAQLNEALRMLDLPVIDTWNPAQIEEQRRNLVFYLAERTLTGNPITLNILGNLTPEVTGLKVSMSPIQDLNGYDYPWAGGTGKNKFDKSSVTLGKMLTNTGIEQTSASGSYSDYIPIVTNTPYYFSHITGSGAFYSMCVYDSSKTFIESADISGSTDASGTLTFTQGSYIRVNVYQANLDTCQIELGSAATEYAPYSNICPISGRTEASVTRTAGEDVETKTHEYNETIWWGVDDFKNGGMEAIGAEIASYDGETLPGEWMSDRDVYAPDTTPTTGAQVVYKNAPTTISTSAEEITLLKGTNVLSTDGDSIELKYKQNF